MSDVEQWAGIVGFPNYAVSDLGNVMNLRTNSRLRPRADSYGYLKVALRRDGRTHDRYIHRLVAAAFILGFQPWYRVRHHGAKDDNHIKNLRFQTGRRVGARVRRPHPAESRHIRIVETGDIFLSVHDCARYIQGDPSSIYRVLRGDRTTHKGLTFEYHYEER